MFPSIKGKCAFKEVAPSDLISGLNFPCSEVSGVITTAPGQGFDSLLNLAVMEINDALNSNSDTEQKRFSGNAVLSANRAFACLVDWYLKSNGFSYCKDAPKGGRRQAEVLSKFGLVDKLLSHVIREAVDLRDRHEHDFIQVELSQAASVVELVRSVSKRLTTEVRPDIGPCFFGNMSFGMSGGAGGNKGHFNGFHGPCFILATYEDNPWLGIISPKNGSVSEADVHYSKFKNVQVEQLFEIYEKIRFSPKPSRSAYGGFLWLLIADEAGLKILKA